MKFKETQVLSTNMLGDPCKFLMPSVKSCVCFVLLIYLVLDKIWAIPVSRLTDRIITHIRSKTIILKFSQLRGVSFAGHYHCGKSVFYSCCFSHKLIPLSMENAIKTSNVLHFWWGSLMGSRCAPAYYLTMTPSVTFTTNKSFNVAFCITEARCCFLHA